MGKKVENPEPKAAEFDKVCNMFLPKGQCGTVF